MAGPHRKAAPYFAAALALAGTLPFALTAARGTAATAQEAAAPATVTPQALVGKPAPAFSLPDQNGAARALADSKGKWVVLAFYPADMTSGCTLQNRAYTAKMDEFTRKNAVVYTVSTQDTKSKQAFCDKEGLKHTLLSDVGGKTAAAYGVLMPERPIARRITFYIAPDGTVADVDTGIKVATAADDSLAKLDALTAAKPAQATAANPDGTIRTIDGQKVTVDSSAGRGYFSGPAGTKVKMGEPVADFALTDTVSGKRQALTTLAAGKKAAVLVWVSTQCPVSNAYNERLAQLAAEYEPKGVKFVGINSNATEDAPSIGAHARQNEWAFPVLKDDKNIIADRFEARVTPEVYVTDAKGVLVYHGPIDDAQDAGKVTKKYLSSALEAVIGGQPVPAADKRAFGCSIKRAK